MGDLVEEPLGLRLGSVVIFMNTFFECGKGRHRYFLLQTLEDISPPAERWITVGFMIGDDYSRCPGFESFGVFLHSRGRRETYVDVGLRTDDLRLDDNQYRELMCEYLTEALEVGLEGAVRRAREAAAPILRERLASLLDIYRRHPLPLPPSPHDIKILSGTEDEVFNDPNPLVEHYFFLPTREVVTEFKAACTGEGFRAKSKRSGTQFMVTFEARASLISPEALHRLNELATSLGGDYDGWSA